MSKHTQELSLPTGPEQAIAACRQAVANLGWDLRSQQAWSLDVKEPGVSLLTGKARVEIGVTGSDRDAQSVVTLRGSVGGAGLVPSRHLREQLDAVQEAIAFASQAAAQLAAEVPAQAQGSPPAGWHPDPTGRHAQRYWDGARWTDDVADATGQQGTDPLEGEPQPGGGATDG